MHHQTPKYLVVLDELHACGPPHPEKSSPTPTPAIPHPPHSVGSGHNLKSLSPS